MLSHIGDTYSFAPLIAGLTPVAPLWMMEEFCKIDCDLKCAIDGEISSDTIHNAMDDFDKVI